MSLSEEQIRRFSRHILLPEVGGVGQERLLSTGVQLNCPPPWMDLARRYLAAAGVQVLEATRSTTMEIALPGGGGVSAKSHSTAGVWLSSSACPLCRGAPAPLDAEEEMSCAASLACSEVLLLSLGLPTHRAWEISPSGVRCEPLPPCVHAPAPHP